MSLIAQSGDFDGFYTANFGDTVAMAYTYTADLAEAQDIAQEAFCRAWRRWTKVSTYDNPVAWVRRVAINLARSRWRRLRMGAAHLVRQHVSEEVPELNPDHVAVVASLRKLPSRQREAVVLHHIMDLPVTEIAEHFEVPVGTVKSWLHRGRGALADDLRLDVRAAIKTPPAEAIFRPEVRKTALGAVVLAVAIAGAVLAVTRLVTSPEPSPVISPNPSPSPSPTDPMLAVDLSRATIRFDLDAEGCQRGELRFEPTAVADRSIALLGNDHGMMTTTRYQPVTGDLDGDGTAEVVMGVYCMPILGGEPRAERLMVVRRAPDGKLTAVAISPQRAKLSQHVWIESGAIFAYARTYPEVPEELGELQAWRLGARGTLDMVDAASWYPPMDVLNLKPLGDRLPCGGAGPEEVREITILRPGEQPVFAERGRSGRPYLMWTIGCRRPGATSMYSSVVVFDRAASEWVAVELPS